MIFDDIIGTATIFLGVAGFIWLVVISDKKDRAERKIQETEFSKILRASLDTKTIKYFSEVLNTYEAFRSEEMHKNQYLRSWLLTVELDLRKETTESDQENKKLIDNIMLVQKWNNELSEKEPFSNLNDAEKALLEDLREYGIVLDDKRRQPFIEKLHNLSELIRKSQEHTDKLEATNRKSVPLSIVGILVSIGFGLYTIFWGR